MTRKPTPRKTAEVTEQGTEMTDGAAGPDVDDAHPGQTLAHRLD